MLVRLPLLQRGPLRSRLLRRLLVLLAMLRRAFLGPRQLGRGRVQPLHGCHGWLVQPCCHPGRRCTARRTSSGTRAGLPRRRPGSRSTARWQRPELSRRVAHVVEAFGQNDEMRYSFWTITIRLALRSATASPGCFNQTTCSQHSPTWCSTALFAFSACRAFAIQTSNSAAVRPAGVRTCSFQAASRGGLRVTRRARLRVPLRARLFVPLRARGNVPLRIRLCPQRRPALRAGWRSYSVRIVCPSVIATTAGTARWLVRTRSIVWISTSGRGLAACML